jgi:streptogramin lyase
VTGPVTTGGGKVWVKSFDTSSERSVVVSLDPGTGEIGRPLDVGPAGDGGIAFGAESVWSGNANDNVVYRIDPETQRTVARVRVESGVGGVSSSIAFGGGAVWVLEVFEGGKLARIDPEANRVLPRIVPVTADEQSALTVGTGSAWVTSAEGNSVARMSFR